MRALTSSAFLFLLLAAILAGQVWWIATGPWLLYPQGGLLAEFDTLLHFSGGVWVALFLLRMLRSAASPVRFANWWWRALGIVACVALVGVLWEFYEFFADRIILGAAYKNQPSVFDTMLDLFADILGGLAVALAGRDKGKRPDRREI